MGNLLSVCCAAALASIGCGVEAEPSPPRPYGANVPSASIVAVGVNWSADVRAWRGMNGVRVRFDCPFGGPLGSVYGSDPYTDDSSVCTAGVHAGRISLADGGVVVIELRAGAASYVATSRNGVSSNAYKAYDGSFTVL